MSEFNSLDARTVHWRQKWVIPNTPWRISGYSRAAYRTGFYIPDLNIMLDAGPQCFNHPKHIFITHSHGDHIANLPFTLIGADEMSEKTCIHAPASAEDYIMNYINSLFEASAMTPISELLRNQEDIYEFHGYNSPITSRMIINKSTLEVAIVLCDHTVPTISYCFSEVKSKLKAEYKDIPGKEIGKLRKNGVSVTEEVIMPRFAFVCDTSIEVLNTHPEILLYPVVFIECTFLYPEEEENAIATKHIHWQHLKPFVLANHDVLFVLIHFSLRYKDSEILNFFEAEQCEIEQLTNIKVWAGDTSEEAFIPK